MNKTASKKKELSTGAKKPATYRRIVTGNVNGKSVVQSDEPLPAYEFKTVPDYEHTLAPLHVMAEVTRLSISVQRTEVPRDTANETHSRWKIDFTGVGDGAL